MNIFMQGLAKAVVVMVAIGFALLAGYGLRVLAEGAPTRKPLFYAGTLEANGKPANGPHTISLVLFDADTGGAQLCLSETPNAPVENGRFRVEVSAACVAELKAQPDVWVALKFTGPDGVPHELPVRTKIGAVPFALEAQHAVAASVASGAAGNLAATLQNVEQRVQAFKIPAVTAWTTVTSPVMRTSTTAPATAIPGQQTTQTYRRIGDSAEIRIRTVFTSTPPSGYFIWELPPGVSVDAAKLPAESTWATSGIAQQWTRSTASICSVNAFGGSISCDCSGGGAMTGTFPATVAAGTLISIIVTVPVAGWSVSL